jgi:TolB-like protein/DNA-binding winged helix-turn-helix (wHTH) protein/Flp pilus assembly protein TadD
MPTEGGGVLPHYQFADLVLDLARRRVTRAGHPIELSALNFDLLRVLVECAPNVVSYDALAEKVWGRHYVSSENIGQRVKLLRQALDDDANAPRYIETVRNKGYRLIPGARSAPIVSPEPSTRLSRRLIVSAAAALGAILVLAGSAYWFASGPTAASNVAPRPPLPNSIAILPFTNLSASPDTDEAAFAAGLHAEVIGRLAMIPTVNVIAQSSVRQYADGDQSIAEIAATLGVETVMESTIRYSGERVRITPSLIDATTGATLWTDIYDREIVDVFAIQEDIALRIAAALGTELSGTARRRSVRSQPTTSSEAAALYLTAVGLELWRSETDSALQLRYLDEALRLDPQFGNAYAMRASIYAISVVDRADRRGGRAASEDALALEKLARENASTALQLDAGSPWPYVAMGEIDQYFWRWGDALRNLTTAYELAPNDVSVTVAYARFASRLGRHDEAVRALQRAVLLDPASPGILWELGIALGHAGRAADAAAVLRDAIAMAPNSVPIRHWLAQFEGILGNRAAALAQLRSIDRGGGDNPTLTAGLLYSNSRIGQSDTVARLFTTLEQLAMEGPVGAGTWALAYLGRGDADQAQHWLRLAVEKTEKHEPDPGFLNLITIKMNMHGNPVLDEPRFRELRNRIGALD